MLSPVLTLDLSGAIGRRPLPPVPWGTGEWTPEARLWGNTIAHLAGLHGFLEGLMAGERLRQGIGKALEEAIQGALIEHMTPAVAQGVRNRGLLFGREIDGEMGAEWSHWFWAAESSWALSVLLGLAPGQDATRWPQPAAAAARVHKRIRAGMTLVMQETKAAELLALIADNEELNRALARRLLGKEGAWVATATN